MKKLLLFIIIFTASTESLSAQSNKELKLELNDSKKKYDSLLKEFYNQQTLLLNRITILESTLDKIKFALGSANQNDIRITQNNSQINTITTQPKNNEVESSNNNNSNSNTTNKSSISVQGKGDGLTPSTGGTIYTGPRGGRYYINKSGNKVYIRKK
jgi:hypothetical protein